MIWIWFVPIGCMIFVLTVFWSVKFGTYAYLLAQQKFERNFGPIKRGATNGNEESERAKGKEVH